MDVPHEQPPALRRRETWALLLLTVGFFTGPIGWLAGWVLTAQSRRWSGGQKVVAALLPVVVFAGLIPGALIVGQIGCDDQPGRADSCDPAPPPIIAWLLAVVVVIVLLLMVIPLIRAAVGLSGRQRPADPKSARSGP